MVACFAACKSKSEQAAPAAPAAPVAPAVAASEQPEPPPPPKQSLPELQEASLESVSDAMNAHDASKYAAAFAVNGVAKYFPTEITGRDKIEAGAKQLFTQIPDLKFAFERTLTKGPIVVATWAWSGTDATSHRPVGLEGTGVLVYGDDGLIKEARVYQNDATIDAQNDPKAKPGTFRPVPQLPASPQAIVSKDAAAEDKLIKALNPMYTALDTKKEADLLAFFTDDSVLDDYSAPAAGKGTKDSKAMYAEYVKTFPDFKQLPLASQVAVGDFVISEGEIKASHTGPIGPIKPTAKPVDVHFIDVVQMKDGKVAHLQTWVNGNELLGEIGALATK